MAAVFGFTGRHGDAIVGILAALVDNEDSWVSDILREEAANMADDDGGDVVAHHEELTAQLTAFTEFAKGVG